MDYETLFNLFDRKHRNIDETAFYFKTDPYETEHFIGYMPQYELPYWVGGCDIENGWQCKTAKELFEAPIFEGKSLKDRWDEVELVQIGGINIDEWRPEDCMKRHYNWGLFWIGFMMNLTKNFIIFILGLVLCIIGIWVKPCLYIGVTLLAIDVVISFIEQMCVKKAVETSTNPDFEPWAEIMSKDNWRDELKKAVNEEIENQSRKTEE